MPLIVVKSQVKDLAVIEEKHFNVSEDFYKRLEEKVKQLIQEACQRAKENSRSTVMGRDV